MSLDEVELSTATRTYLFAAGLHSVEDIRELGQKGLRLVPGIGPRRFREVADLVWPQDVPELGESSSTMPCYWTMDHDGEGVMLFSGAGYGVVRATSPQGDVVIVHLSPEKVHAIAKWFIELDRRLRK